MEKSRSPKPAPESYQNTKNGRSGSAGKKQRGSVVIAKKPPKQTAVDSDDARLTDALDTEENEEFFDSESARRAILAIHAALMEDETRRQRALKVVGTWLTKGESEWINEINTTELFDVTLEVIRLGAYPKGLREKVARAFVNRLKTTRNAVSWIRWLRSALGRGDLTLLDIRPNLEPLLTVMVLLISKSRHAIASASKNISLRKQIELWIAHAETSVEVGNALLRSPDGISPLLVSNPQVTARFLTPRSASNPSLNSPGAFVMHLVASLILTKEDGSVEGQKDWLDESVFTNEALKHLVTFAEMDAWMYCCSFAFEALAAKSKVVTLTLAKSNRLIQHIFETYGELYVEEVFVSPKASVSSSSSTSLSEFSTGLLVALDALSRMKDLVVSSEMLLALHKRHILFSIENVGDAFHQVCSSLAEVGVQLVVDQVVRYASLLVTHSWSLREGDCIEHMVLMDLAWLESNPLTKLFFDGSLLLRLTMTCAWPDCCPFVAERLLSFARVIGKARPSGESGPTWDKLLQMLAVRFQRAIDLSPPAKGGGVSSVGASVNAVPFSAKESTNSYLEARREFTKFIHDDRFVPIFARKEFGLDFTKLNRAKRFADAVLGILNDESSNVQNGLDWREEAAQVFWESYLECTGSIDEPHDRTQAANLPSRANDALTIEEEFRAWLCIWACRGLTITTLRSRFGSPKDTFQQFEAAIERRKSQGEDIHGLSRFLLTLLWNLHREILVCAPIHPDNRISSFFVKNAETCHSWLLRLVGAALGLDQQIDATRGASAIFYFSHYDELTVVQKPVGWTVLLLESLSRRRDSSAIRALATRLDVLPNSSSKAWIDAFEAFSRGAYMKSAREFERTLSILEEETEGWSSKLNEEEMMKKVSSKKFIAESYIRLGEWTKARQSLDVADEEESAKTKLILVESLEGLDSNKDKGGVLGVDLNDALQKTLLDNPSLAFLRWCSEPSSTTTSSLLKQACTKAQLAGRREAQELTLFAGGKTGRSPPSATAPSSSRPTRPMTDSPRFDVGAGDELWSVLDSARRRFGLPRDVHQIASMSLRALHAGDVATARVLMAKARPLKADEASRDADLFLSLGREIRRMGKSENSESLLQGLNVMLPPSIPERAILDLTPASAQSAINEILHADSKEMTNKNHSTTSLMALAGFARLKGELDTAAKLHWRALKLDSGSISQSQSLGAFLLYLEETDNRGMLQARADELAELPSSVLRRGLPHILARTGEQNVGPALEKLARESPREVVWGIVASEPSPSIDAGRRAIGSRLLQEATILKSSLVEASRTFDEDWDDYLEELAKKPWLERALSHPASSNSLAETTQQLWRETLGREEDSQAKTSLSHYHQVFLESEAGQAIREFVQSDHPTLDQFNHMRNSLGKWNLSQSSKRVFSDLCSDASLVIGGSYSVIPGGEGALYSIAPRVDVLRTKTRPRKIGFVLAKSSSSASADSSSMSNKNLSPRKNFLLKSAEDLRLDERLVRLWEMVVPSSKYIRSYTVVPLSRRVGLIEWVERAVPLFHAYREWKDMSWLLTRGTAGATAAHMELEKGERNQVTEQYQKALASAGMNKLDAFREVRSTVDQKLLSKFLWNTSRDAEMWWSRTMTFASTCGATSALGWMVGLGDRHLDNILLDVDSGQVIHVDLNVCFDKGLKLRVPETVPFRLTGIMTGAMPFGGRRASLERGPFGTAMEETIDAIRGKKEEILSFLSSFVFDPIRPQSSTSRVGLLELDRTEIETLKLLFAREAEAWLNEPGLNDVALLNSSLSRHGGGEEEEDASSSLGGGRGGNRQFNLEKSKSLAHKALGDLNRRKDKAFSALDRVVNTGERILSRRFEFDGPTSEMEAGVGGMVPEKLLILNRNLDETMRELIETGMSTLERCVSLIKRHSSPVSKLGLGCVEWGDKLNDIIKKANTSSSNDRDTSSLSRKSSNKSSSSSLKPLSMPGGFDPDDMQTIESLRRRVKEGDLLNQLKTYTSAIAEQANDPRVRSFAQKLERKMKQSQEFLLLVEAVGTIFDELKEDSCNAAQTAHANLRAAMARSGQPTARPGRSLHSARNLLEKPPNAADLLATCAHLRVKHHSLVLLAKYQELLSAEGRLTPQKVPQAAELLEEVLPLLIDLEWTKEPVAANDTKAESQAKQANARVQARLDDETDTTKLVSVLIEQATSEKNLSEMWVGWMAFL